MNYKRIYDSIIDRANNRILEGYSEIHHIIPRCMGGNNSKSNLVKLTPEEHYIVHQLLIKIYPNNPGLIKAAIMMTVSNDKHIRTNNKLFGWLRRQYSLSLKGKDPWNKGIKLNKPAWNKGLKCPDISNRMQGNKNSLGRTVSDESKQKMSNAQKDLKPVICPHCNKSGGIQAMKRWHFDNCKLQEKDK